ncbi:MAG: MATE family efflux transporter [Polyangiales bacterium]
MPKGLPSRDRTRRILRLALPILGAMASQNVLNLVDAAMLAHLGDRALAAVGATSLLNFVLSAVFMGSSAGVQAIAARRVGEGRGEDAAGPLDAGLLVVLAIAVPWAIVLHRFAPSLVGLMSDDPAVIAEGTPYLRARLFAVPAIGMNFAFRGFWSAVDRPGLYMKTLVFVHGTTILLDYLLIDGRFGFPALGATGAGVANAIALWLGTVTYVGLGLRHARGHGFLRRLPDRESVLGIVRVGLPAGLQQLVYSLGLAAFAFVVARIGTRELAASKILTDVLLVFVLPGLGFGLASATLVGQSLGARQPDEAERWTWDVVRVATLLVAVMAVPALLFPDLVLRGFLRDPATRALAVPVLRLLMLGVATDTIGTVLMNALLGAGDAKRVVLVGTVLQWGICLPAAYLLGVRLGLGLFAAYAAQVAYRQLQVVVFSRLFKQGAWRSIRV